MRHFALNAAARCLVAAALVVPGAPAHADDPDLFEMSLEDLLAIKVFSVAKKSQRLLDSASAVHVITGEDIHRSGHTSVMELLRMVPGLNVSQVDGGAWAISARGGQAQFDRNLLVMIDGRSVYTPLFAGVFWDLQDIPLEDIAQIEVIRGPGGTIWGDNAVNGVINIITRPADDTQGSLVSARHGNMERAGGTFRHGVRLGEGAALRLSGNYRNMDRTQGTGGLDSDEIHDGFRSGGLNGRLDWSLDDRDALTFTFNRFHTDREGLFRLYDSSYSSPAGQLVEAADAAAQGHGGVSWRRELGEQESLEVSGWLDTELRRSPRTDLHRRVADLDFQHNLRRGAVAWSWGLGARNYTTRTQGSQEISFNHADRHGRHTDRQGVYGGFAQASLPLLPDALSLTAGSKLSYNTYSGWEAQPSARMLWKPDERHQIWAAVSRAVRTPSIADRDVSYVASVLPFVPFAALPGAGLPPTYPCHEFAISPGGQNCPIFLRGGGDDMESEVLLSYELGYRAQPTKAWSSDVALFYMDYENQRYTPVTPAVDAGELVLVQSNADEARSYGAEVSTTWQVGPSWQLRAAWWGIQQQVNGAHSPERNESTTPHHFWLLASRLDLPGNLELDTAVYFQGRREFESSPFQPTTKLGSHQRVDVRLGWHANERLELSLVALDLFDRQDQEFAPIASPQEASQTQRSVYGQVRWAF